MYEKRDELTCQSKLCLYAKIIILQIFVPYNSLMLTILEKSDYDLVLLFAREDLIIYIYINLT